VALEASLKYKYPAWFSEQDSLQQTPSTSNTLECMADSVSLSWNEIGNVKAMVEKCMQQYMTQAEIIATLQTQAGVQPSVTCLVWQKLEEQNQSFFYSYNAMLRVKDQLSLFDYLVEQQSCVMKASAQPASNTGL